MSIITLDVPQGILAELSRRADRAGHPLQEEVRLILQQAAADTSAEHMPDEEYGLATAIHEAFKDIGWVDLPDVRDRTPAEPMKFDP